MSKPLRVVESRSGELPDDVIRRVIKAWIGAYEMTQDEFADALGMNHRTFARRLSGIGKGSRFTAAEIRAISAFMADCLGEAVEVGDVFMGRIDVSRPWVSEQPSFPNIRTKLRAIPGLGRDPQPRTPLLTGI